jgi:ABC-type glycerol-3-phosphate transport system permease component
VTLTPRSSKQLKLALTYVVLSLGALFMLFPIFWMVTTAFKSEAEIFATPVRWLPSTLHWENFTVPLTEKPFARWFFNSILIASSVTLGNLLISSLAGFGFSKYRFPGRGLLFLLILATFMIPLQVTMIPLFFIVKGLGWVNSFWGLIVPIMVDAFGIFLMRQFIDEIPNDYMDQARIDGAPEWRIWWSVILPMTWPILSALGILTFLASFDELLWPLILVTSDEMRTVPLGLATFENTYQTIYNQLMAMALLAMIPVFIVFVVFQRRIIQGVTFTGIKG